MATQSPEIALYERLFGPFVHMSQGEKAIWVRWLQKGGSQYAPFIYDLRVGDGLNMGPTATAYEKSRAFALTTKRIDALYIRDHVAVIIEVKPRAGLSAVGQLLGYRDLLRATPNFTDDIAMLLVTDTLQPDMETVLTASGISWNEVGL